ncbi:hypothetical protein Tco_1535693 [Tanacetum coccineum]
MRPRLWLHAPVSSTRFSSTTESYTSDSTATTLDRHSHSPSHSAGPSRKRCRSPTTIVPLSIPVSGALVPTHADLLLPHVLADIQTDTAAVKVAADIDVKAWVDTSIGIEIEDDIEDEDEVEAESNDRGTMEVGVDVVARIDIPDGMLMLNAMEHLEQVEEVVHDIYGHIMEIPLQRVEDIEMGQRQLEAESLVASGERVGLLDHVAGPREEQHEASRHPDDGECES